MDGRNRTEDLTNADHADAERLVRRYYAHIDAGDYEALAALLDPAFVHDRPDRTLDGRDRFVAFMRDERPMTDTEHVVDAVYANGSDRAARGRLLDADGEVLFAFLDVFSIGTDRIESLRTYTGDDEPADATNR
ncbi:nuclear transport factor 2 family protein [Halopenitus salinus]|jgi:ketosteroid isomerase-like protein|uniref:Nuclear transport factor 2 family protein n=1 Tax=Halopenitus salinus TaxID=1198295 RepID=A0ABD5UTW3_9EURY